MANNPYVNKVVYGNQTLFDLTSVNVTADKVMKGYTTKNNAGVEITGTAIGNVVYVIGQRALWKIPETMARVEGTKLILTERS